MGRPSRLFLALWGLGWACAPLPELSSEVCGNGVVEEGEACDRFPPEALEDPDLVCGAPELLDGRACRLICDPATGQHCPLGWACGADGTCRYPRWSPGRPYAEVELLAENLEVADLDGDGRPDVYSATQDLLQVLYGDGAGGFGDSTERRTGARAGVPSAGDLDGDRRDDLVVPLFGGIDVLGGTADRTLAPRIQTVPIAAAGPFDLRGVLARVGPICPGARPVITVISTDEGTGTRLLSLWVLGSEPITSIPLDQPGLALDRIDGPIPVADLDGDQVDEILIALPGLAGGALFRPEVIGSPGRCNSARFRVSEPVLIPTTGVIDGRSLFTDVNGDGVLDAVFDTDMGFEIALGPPPLTGPWPTIADARGLYDATCTELVNGSLDQLLAAGPIDERNGADLLLKDAIYFDAGSSVTPGQLVGRLCRAGTIPGRINDGALGDFNGDGRTDVVAISRVTGYVNVSLQNEVGFSLFDFPLPREAEKLRVGDFDGDGFEDAAFSEGGGGGSRLRVLYGGPALGLAEPIEMGELPRIVDLEAGRLGTGGGVLDGRSDLFVSANDSGAESGVNRIAFMAGQGSRRMFAPLLLIAPNPDHEIRVLASFALDGLSGPEPDLLGYTAIVDGRTQEVVGQQFIAVPGSGTGVFGGAEPVVADPGPTCGLIFRLPDRDRTCVHGAAGALDPGAPASVVALDGDPGCGLAATPEFCVFTPSRPEAPLCAQPSTITLEGVPITPESLRTVDLTDLDGDGDQELIVGFEGVVGAPGVAVYWRTPGVGACGFEEGVGLPLPASPRAITPVNLDDDPALELAVLLDEQVVAVEVAEGRLLLGNPVITRVGAQIQALAAADLDQDGLSELLLGRPAAVELYAPAAEVAPPKAR